MDTIVVYMTAASQDEAERIGTALVQARLAACVNVLGPVRSIYQWRGELRRETETAFLAKTTADRLHGLIAEVRAMHSHDVPCIVALPTAGGNPDFLAWIMAQTTHDNP